MVSSVFTHVPLFILKLRINIKIKNFYKSFYVIFAGSSKEIALQVLMHNAFCSYQNFLSILLCEYLSLYL